MTRLNSIFVGYLLLLSAKTLLGQPKKGNENSIVIGQIITLKSDVLKEQRPIYVALPGGYDTLTSNLPVIYVLDAEYRFGIAQSIQSYFYLTTRIPQAILIGIANPSKEARQRDYLPNSYGGDAEKFSQFLSKEVFRFVEQKYRANQKRYLVGHSH